MIQYIPFTQKMFSTDSSMNVTSLQSKHGVHQVGQWDTIIYLLYINHGMQPWRPIIFYNNSMDAAGTAKLTALYVLANINVKLTISPRWVDPW